jgi:hypothetical protein
MLPTSSILRSDHEAGRDSSLVVVVIPTRVKWQMQRHLRATYNRSRSVLFPDVGGFVDVLREGEV